MSTSILPGLARTQHAIASISTSCARNPCNFQLPAISIRIDFSAIYAIAAISASSPTVAKVVALSAIA